MFYQGVETVRSLTSLAMLTGNLGMFSTVLFLIAAYRYGLKLQRRIHYGA